MFTWASQSLMSYTACFNFVSNKRGFPGRHHNSTHRLLIVVQTVSTLRVSIVYSRYIQEPVPHLLTEQSLGPNVSVVEKKERKTRTEFSRFNSLFFPLFSREQKTFSRKAGGAG